MLLYNGQNPLSQPQYSIESYEPIDIKPEEQKQNNNYIAMAFTGQKLSNYQNPIMKNNKMFIRSLTDNKINGGFVPTTNTFQFGKNNLIQVFNSTANTLPIQNIKTQKVIVPTINYNVNQQISYPHLLQRITKCNSSKNLVTDRQQIIVNNNMVNNKILLPTNNVLNLSPHHITTKITYNNKNIIPIYHKIVYRRKNVV